MIDFQDKVVVITGSLRPLKRQEVIALLKSKGAIVHGYVSSQTDILLAGHKQLDLFDPDRRSKKYNAALARIAEGQSITIVSEEAFFNILKESQV
ncbi:BRCT domain-containing protein [Streptococcus suis]|uniref:BRCT domain-containing protein n=1 Tax=Streptococcus suis TaxID=1307 RepID=UPI001ABDAF13|nr:BRCT domain-containing protein [Streptococcus suis]MBO4108807.1 BRCT domain-containing protein [Streptococcus suis]